MSFSGKATENKELHTQADVSDDPGAVKTHLNCDPVTLARDVGQVAKHVSEAGPVKDELSELYRPLGNKDVQCFVGT